MLAVIIIRSSPPHTTSTSECMIKDPLSSIPSRCCGSTHWQLADYLEDDHENFHIPYVHKINVPTHMNVKNYWPISRFIIWLRDYLGALLFVDEMMKPYNTGYFKLWHLNTYCFVTQLYVTLSANMFTYFTLLHKDMQNT